jgi:hypothetical protein
MPALSEYLENFKVCRSTYWQIALVSTLPSMLGICSPEQLGGGKRRKLEPPQKEAFSA